MTDSSVPERRPSRDSKTHRLRLFEDVGSAVIGVVHFAFKEARKLPFHVGRSVAYVEDTLSPWLEPVIVNVEKEGLHLLSLADTQINAASDAAVDHIPLASVFITPLHVVLSGQAVDILLSGLKMLQRRGLIGCTADAWVEYEPVVKNTCQGVYKLVNKVPGSRPFVYFFHDIGYTLVFKISEWMINHSEKRGKHQLMFTDHQVEPLPIESSPKGLNDVKVAEDDANPPASELDTHSQTSSIDEKAADEKAGNSTEENEGSTSEISVMPVEEQTQAEAFFDDRKGTVKQVSPPHADLEEHDDILDLFDTWGLGQKAISPKGLQKLRTLSFQNVLP